MNLVQHDVSPCSSFFLLFIRRFSRAFIPHLCLTVEIFIQGQIHGENCNTNFLLQIPRSLPGSAIIFFCSCWMMSRVRNQSERLISNKPQSRVYIAARHSTSYCFHRAQSKLNGCNDCGILIPGTSLHDAGYPFPLFRWWFPVVHMSVEFGTPKIVLTRFHNDVYCLQIVQTNRKNKNKPLGSVRFIPNTLYFPKKHLSHF